MMEDGNWTCYEVVAPPYSSASQLTIITLLLVTNILSLVVWRKHGLHGSQHWYFIGLTAAHLLNLPSLCISAVGLLRGSLCLTPILCDGIGILTILPHDITSLLLIAMAIDKCHSIAQPTTLYLRRQTEMGGGCNIALIITVSFVFPLILNCVWALARILKSEFNPILGSCYVNWTVIALYSQSPFLFLSVIVHLVAFMIIIIIARQSQQVGRSGILSDVAPLSWTVFLYYLLWLPYGCWIMISVFSAPLTHQDIFLYWTLHIYACYSCTPLLICVITLPSYRKVIIGLLTIREIENTGREMILISKTQSNTKKAVLPGSSQL